MTKKKTIKKVGKKEITRLADVAKRDEEGLLTIAELKETAWGLTDEVRTKLRESFEFDFTVREACSHAGIASDTFYKWRNKSIEFRAEMEAAKDFLFQHAKRNVAKAIRVEKSVDDSWMFLTKRQKDLYSDRQEVQGKVDVTSYTIVTNADTDD